MARALHNAPNMTGAPPQNPAASVVNVTKAFNGTCAVDRATVDFFPGQIVGLVGPNGSGKTTLVNLLCGHLVADAGEVRIGGRLARLRHPADALQRGVRMLPQATELYPGLSVLENIFIGQERRRFGTMMSWRRMADEARTLLDEVGAHAVDPLKSGGDMSGGQKKAVALARLLARPAAVLVFDEPLTALGVDQRALVVRIMSEKAASGCAVVFITHDVDDVLLHCDRVVALRLGRVVIDSPCNAISRTELEGAMATNGADARTPLASASGGHHS